MNFYLSNGRQTLSSQQSYHLKRAQTKVVDIPPFDQKNWLIYIYFVQGNFHICRLLIEKELERTYQRNIYAYYINVTRIIRCVPANNPVLVLDESMEAKIFQIEGKIQESLEKFQTCHKLDPVNVNYIKQVAQCLFILKRYRLSLEAYIEAENLIDKPDWEIFYNIGKCLLKLGVPDKALEYVKRSAQLSQQEGPFLLLNKLLITKGDYVTAVSVCNAALEYCPESVDVLIELGILHIRLQQSQLAFERLGSALALDSSNSKALLAIGCIMQNHGDFDVALSKYRIAAHSIPYSSSLWSNIGLCFYAKQKFVGAISCLLRALWISPLNWRILYNLGLIFLSTHQYASAFHFLCASVNLQPEYAYSFMLLGIALRNLEDFINSYKAFEQSAFLLPNDAIVALNYAISLQEKGLVDETVQQMAHFKEIIQDSNSVDEELLNIAEKLASILPTTQSKQIRSPDDEPEYAEILDSNVETGNFEDLNNLV